MKLTHICCFAILTLSSIASAYDNRPIVVLREDDVWSNCRDVMPEFGNKSFLAFAKQLKMPITWGVITSRASAGGSVGLSWAELNDYVAFAGGELASHSSNHMPMSSLQAYVDDLLQSKLAIQANSPYACNTFYQPGTWTNDANFNAHYKMDNILGQAIQQNFRQSLMYLPGQQFGIGSPVWKYGSMNTCALDYVNGPVTNDVLKSLDYISQIAGVICITSFHGIQSSTNTMSYCTRADLMAAYLTKLAELRDAGLVRVMSVDDAFNNNQFAPDINRVFDSGFELHKAEIVKYITIWTLPAGGSIVDQVGYNNSRCGRIIPGGELRQTVYLPSGRYKLTWLQKPDTGTALGNNGVTPQIGAINNKTSIQYTTVVYPLYKNTSNEWEEKSIILKIPDQANRINARFYVSSTGAFLIDNVSIRQISTDPNECVSGFKVTPSPNGLQLNWRAPDNAQYKRVYLKYNLTQRCPQALSEGTTIQEVAIGNDNGKAQSFSCPFGWAGKGSVFFSAFAVKEDNTTYSEPDVDFILTDQSKPVVTNLTTALVGVNEVYTSWLSNTVSDIYATKYSVGNAPLDRSFVDWTMCNRDSVRFGPLEVGKKYYVNLQSQNIFGIWSDLVHAPITLPVLYNLESTPNGTIVRSTGVVSAIFSGCYYIQFPERMRGIKVIGPTDSVTLGMTVTVEGVLQKDAGERYIDVGQ